MREKIIVGLLILCFLNCVSFSIARVVLSMEGGVTGKFVRELKDRGNGAMTYLIAGNLNQPLTAYEFLEPELHGYVTYVQFRLMGWSAKATADKIANEVKDLGLTKVDVYTISLGDHVGRYLEEMIGDICDLQIIAINPCTDVSFMCPPLGILLKIGAPVFDLACHVLGWISVIPMIPADGGKYSLMLLADQYLSIAYDRPAHRVENTIGVICSNPRKDEEDLSDKDDNDGLLQNSEIRAYFQHDLEDAENVQIVTIKTNHGDTIGAGDEYLDGIQRILYDLG